MPAGCEQITEPVAFHGEGPVWSESWGGLRYVDMHAGDVLCLDAATGDVTRSHLGGMVAAIRPRTSGGMVAGLERGFALVEADGSVRDLGPLWSDQSVRMNDGTCDPDGRFYCGSMARDAGPGRGCLYRLGVDGEATVVLDPVGLSNGMAWSADRARAYYVDSLTQRIDVFDYEREALQQRRPFAVIEEAAGMPDGLTVDAEGGVWVALWGGGAVRRYSADGQLDAEVRLPVTQVTACAFGGPTLDTLFITTSREGVSAEAQPQAGAVFRALPGVTGVETLPYRG